MAKEKGKYPIDQSTFIELSTEIANLAVEQWSRDTGKEALIETKEGSSYTEEAQEIFNPRYDEAQGILVEVLGQPPWLK